MRDGGRGEEEEEEEETIVPRGEKRSANKEGGKPFRASFFRETDRSAHTRRYLREYRFSPQREESSALERRVSARRGSVKANSTASCVVQTRFTARNLT